MMAAERRRAKKLFGIGRREAYFQFSWQGPLQSGRFRASEAGRLPPLSRPRRLGRRAAGPGVADAPHVEGSKFRPGSLPRCANGFFPRVPPRSPPVATGKRDDISMNIKRMRGRGHRPGGSGSGGGGGGGGAPRHHAGGGGVPLNRNHVFDSSGPDLRIRGTAQQLFEKYLQLGRDATSGGDRVMAESYFQHAEHYFRILNAMAQVVQQGQPGGAPNQPRRYNGEETPSFGQDGAEDGASNPPGTGDQPEARDIPIAAAPEG